MTGASGFVVAYAHYGDGVIIYDGVDRDQGANVAYRQYLARQLLLPFAPDPLPCSTRLSPFVVTTDASLVTRTVLPGQTNTYPLSIVPVRPGYTGRCACRSTRRRRSAISTRASIRTPSRSATKARRR